MKVSRRRPLNRATRIQTSTLPAPVGGLNARDSLSAMPPTDALQLDNVVCRPSYVEVRKGRQPTATGFTAPVETLFTYSAVGGTQEQFAAAGDSIFDSTASGAIGAAVVTGLTSAYWNYTQVSNTAGNFLICCNGVDNAKVYDGSAWSNFGGTGLALTDIVQVSVWKRRLWCVEKNSFSVWYGATDAIAGALTEFTFSGIFRRGGKLVAVLNWTVDGGDGTDDYFVAITSMGEVALYRGTDPAAAATFALVGVYFIGPPVGTRFYAKLGGDLILLTSEGLIPLSRYIQSQDKTSALTDQIQQLISQDISSYGTTQGWEVHVYHDDNFLFVQVPAGTLVGYQYVMNLITRKWSRFTIGVALTWAVQNNTLYMADASRVFNAWTGGTDETEPISFFVIPAFSYFKSPTQRKYFQLTRLLMESDLSPRYRTKLLRDFNRDYFFPALTAAPSSGNLWDVALWDAGSWDSLAVYDRQWRAISGDAYAATQIIYGVSSGSVSRLISIDYTYEVGGLL